jgi:hypothetical protein
VKELQTVRAEIGDTEENRRRIKIPMTPRIVHLPKLLIMM